MNLAEPFLSALAHSDVNAILPQRQAARWRRRRISQYRLEPNPTAEPNR
jgi:hypothetical protein